LRGGDNRYREEKSCQPYGERGKKKREGQKGGIHRQTKSSAKGKKGDFRNWGGGGMCATFKKWEDREEKRRIEPG